LLSRGRSHLQGEAKKHKEGESTEDEFEPEGIDLLSASSRELR